MSEWGGRLIRLTLILCAASMLWACEGSDGKDGAAGAPGGPGPAGPPGAGGPPGAAGSVPASSADKVNVEVTSVTIPAGGGAPVVELTLTNDLTQGLFGLPANEIRFILAQLSPAAAGSNGSSAWQNYISRASGAFRQGDAERAQNGTLTDNGDGTYTYEFANALADYTGAPVFDAAKTHRLGIEIRNESELANNGIFDFVPATGAAPDPLVDDQREIVDNDTCNACHDVLNFHGGPRTDVPYCVTCHNPSSIDGDTGNSVDMKRLIHNIHAGRDGFVIIGYRNTVYDYSDIQWTQDPRNCQTCHEEDDTNTPQASNWRLVPTREACGTCHYDDGLDNGINTYAIEDGVHPGGFNFADDTQCVDCHGPDGTVTGSDGRLVQVPVAHELQEVTANEAFAYEVVSVTNTAPGQIPSATIRVSNPLDGTTYDINDPAGPFQIGSSRLNLDIAWTSNELANLDPNDDLARAPDSGAPFGPIQIAFQSGAVDDGNGNFTKAAPVAIPTGISGSGIAVLEGRAAVDIDGSLDNLPVSSEVLVFAITDATPQERRDVVDIDKCNDCHKNLALHGDNRSGNTEVCSTCHNPNATDINRRVAESECEAELGLDDAPIDLKRMIHGIHAGAIGVCGYRNSAHPYFGVVYPGRLNNCEGCHTEGEDSYYPVDPAQVLATTVDAGADRSSLLDDVAISPNTSVCSACHTSSLAAEHMKQNGGDFEAGKMEDGTLSSAGVETCELCHGPGRSADVGEIHGVGDFQFN